MKRGNIAIFVPHCGCPNDCSFCNQRTISGTFKAPTAEEVKRICDEALERSTIAAESVQIAFFGGSFTAIERELMVALLEAAYRYVADGRVSGIRVSTRPDAIDGEVLNILKKYGVESIELGIQSMRDEVLVRNRRGHNSQQVREAAGLIKEFGFEFGAQMMTGLYGDDDEGAEYTAGEILKLGPDTVRIYPTVVLKGTELERLMRCGKYLPKDAYESVGLCASLIRRFEEAGVRVIRVGLHASENVESEMVGGAYHPAFRELCEGELMKGEILDSLKCRGQGDYTVLVNPKDISKAVGQGKRNINELKKLGYNVTIKGNEKVGRGAAEIQEG